jgi:large subunit ribosomal protein L13
MKTFQPTQKEVKRSWHLVDAKGAILGRTAGKIATFLTGKHKADYSPHMDSGDYVIVINAKEVELTGKKKQQKLYRSHSGYPGGFREVTFEKMNKEKPTEVIKHAVSGMLPGNRIKRDRMARLKIFAGETHPYQDKLNG